jgi:hypothetical protein
VRCDGRTREEGKSHTLTDVGHCTENDLSVQVIGQRLLMTSVSERLSAAEPKQNTARSTY